MKRYIEKILLPYVNRKWEDLKLQPDHPVLTIFDNFTGQGTESLLELLEANHIHVVLVPANCTDRLQPLDVSVNKPAKNFLRQQFQKCVIGSLAIVGRGVRSYVCADLLNTREGSPSKVGCICTPSPPWIRHCTAKIRVLNQHL